MNKKGFTLLEVLLVIAIIAILAGIVILALNPTKQLAEANNAQRRMDTNSILNAIYQYSLDNNGNFPSGIDTTYTSAQVLGTATVGCDSVCSATSTVAACLDLTSELIATYIVGVPADPSSGFASATDYYVDKDTEGRLTVGSCDPEESATIEITR